MTTINEIANGQISLFVLLIEQPTIEEEFQKRSRKKFDKSLKNSIISPIMLARNLSLSTTFQTGLIMSMISHDSHYWELAIKGIDNAKEKFKLHKVNVKYFQYEGYSERSSEKASEKVLTENFDGLLMASPIHSTIDEVFVTKISPRLPNVFFISNFPNTNCISYIRQDSFQSSILAANLICPTKKEKRDIAVLTMLHEDDHILSSLIEG